MTDPAGTTENSKDIFDLERSFADLGLKQELLQAVEKMGFVNPTHVQAQILPLALAGRDVLAQSRTGSGKTAAFGLPVLQVIQNNMPFAALILTPTRELAIQVTHDLRELGRNLPLRIMPVYGGQRMGIQIDKLAKNPQIIVGTPGRVMDMHRRGHLPYDKIRIAILDEVDRMLDIGFRDDMRRILGTMKQKHQTIFVSATISREIEQLARSYMHKPERLELSESGSITVQQVKQEHFSVQPWDKKRLLVHLLKHEVPSLTLIFCRTKQTVDGLTDYLNKKNIEAHAIHGDMYQGKRNRVMQKLRDGQLSVLVASDLAARGLDVDDITHVINYDIPEDPEIYVHRIGRTARAGKSGEAWTFITPDQGELLTNIEMFANIEIPKSEYRDFEPGPVPADVAAQMELKSQRQEMLQRDRKRTSSAPVPPGKEVDPDLYPGGVVPSKRPARRMGGRLRTRRR